MSGFKLGVCQLHISDEKAANLERARELILRAAASGCQVAVLPEMFNCPYDHEFFIKFAETAPDGQTLQMLARTAGEAGITIIGGSIPEKSGENLYNTSFVFGPDGTLLGRQRKVHLFEVEHEALVFRESDTLRAGAELNVINTPVAAFGIAICFDIRFPELFRTLVLQGAQVVVIPAAFNLITGPVHWELLLRARAVDNQVYTVGASAARDPNARYVCYGHSMVVDPWSTVIGRLDEQPGLLVADIDYDVLEKVRAELPLLTSRRTDLIQLKF